MPPPPPRACFGRDELIEEVVGLAENLEPIALIGAGGIGKTSIALAVLHHDQIKNRFGANRRFIRCDQFPPTSGHLLNRLSGVIGAGVVNPEDLTPLRPFLSSEEMIIFLDNAESIFDPQGRDARKIYSVVEELSRFSNICLGITSRISTVPSHCKRPTIPTLSTESACDIFYGIYSHCGRSNVVKDLVRQLDFHALSITLLATTASHNMWDYDRLVREWDTRRTQVLLTDHCGSLAATIELSIASPTFHDLVSPTPFRKLVTSSASRKLLPSRVFCKLFLSARDLLEVVAFFPQGIDERNLDWLFPAVRKRKNILDKFCVLSLTYRHQGFITMLAPIRDYFVPRDPNSSPLIRTTKRCYFTRLSAHLSPGRPGFGESRWIKSEDVNVEHLLDVFTSVDESSDDVWDACVRFMSHLYWHKPRQTILMRKIEDLPVDSHPKPRCLFRLAELSGQVGDHTERKRLLVHALALWRKRGDNFQVARTLQPLSESSRMLGLCEEGIQQAKEASEIFERLGKPIRQAQCLNSLALSLHGDNQLDAAEDTVSRAINLLPEKGQEFLVCQSHRLLGLIHHSRGDKEKAVFHFETGLRIASPFDWHDELFWNHYCLAWLFCEEGEFDDASAHIERAKPHAADNAYRLGRAMKIHAEIFERQHRLEDARSEALRALDIYKKLGATRDAEGCSRFLRELE